MPTVIHSAGRGMVAVAVAALTVATACDGWANFVPGQGRYQRHPVVSMDFDQPWGFVYNLPRSTNHVGKGGANEPLGYSTNKYVSPVGSWLHSVDAGSQVVTNLFNYLIEDGWRGSPLEYSWTTTTVAKGTGALRMATAVDGVSMSDALSYNMLPGVTNGSFFPAAEGASIVLNVHVPEPTTWQPDGNYAFLLMSMVGDPAEWPGIWCQRYDTNYSWECDVQALGGDYTNHNYLTHPAMRITGAGWWTVGASMDGDGGVNYYLHSGTGTLSEADYVGSYQPMAFTTNYGLFGTFYIRNTSTTLSPDWVVDEVNYYHYLPPPGPALILLVR